jgi:hypothetical protein
LVPGEVSTAIQIENLSTSVGRLRAGRSRWVGYSSGRRLRESDEGEAILSRTRCGWFVRSSLAAEIEREKGRGGHVSLKRAPGTKSQVRVGAVREQGLISVGTEGSRERRQKASDSAPLSLTSPDSPLSPITELLMERISKPHTSYYFERRTGRSKREKVSWFSKNGPGTKQ